MTTRPQPSRSGPARWLIVAAVVVAVALVSGIIWRVIGSDGSTDDALATDRSGSSTATGPGCPNPIPAGASRAAIAYLHALDLGRPYWAAVSTKLYQEDRHPHLSDMAPQAAADGVFLTALQQTTWPAADQSAANDLMNAVATYRNLLLGYEKNWSLFDEQTVQRNQVTDTRSAASARLRALLDLPPATCGYYRP